MATAAAPTSIFDFPFAVTRYASDFATTTFGVETYAEAARLTPLLMKHFNPTAKVAPEIETIGGLGESTRRIASALAIPSRVVSIAGRVQEFARAPNGETTWDLMVSGARLLPPLYDGAQLMQMNKIFQFSAPTLALFSRIQSAAMAFFAFDWILRDFVEIGKGLDAIATEAKDIKWVKQETEYVKKEWTVWKEGATKSWGGGKTYDRVKDVQIMHLDPVANTVASPAEGDLLTRVINTKSLVPGNKGNEMREGWALRKIGLALVDLCKAVSYVALAMFALLSASAFWILAASTSALFFTLIGEFAGRSFIEYAKDVQKLLEDHTKKSVVQLQNGVSPICLNIPYTNADGWTAIDNNYKPGVL
ncbi:MAG: hypothetical protein HYX48_08160 [Chlamydiales bacterium]|nr:hypothetical protein [Chlamydiales bacterium]